MDTLTHALVGTAISDGFFRKRLGPAATPFAFLVAASPDLDILAIRLLGYHPWLEHRGYTHSFVPQLIAATILGGIGLLVSGRVGRWRDWFLLSVLCLFSHTFIDLATSWGTMPFLPFSWDRVSWDIAPILDVFVTSLTAASFVANRILRWERVVHFMNPVAYPRIHKHPRRVKAAGITAATVVFLCVAYLLIGVHQNYQTVRLAREELAKAGITPVEVRALPIMFTYIAWEIAAREADGTIYNAVHSSYAPRPMRFTRFASIAGSDADARTVLANDEAQYFAWRAQNMFVTEKVPAVQDGVTIRLNDRRFFSLAPGWAPRNFRDFRVDSAGLVQRVPNSYAGFYRRDRLIEEFNRLWQLTWHGTLGDGGGNNDIGASALDITAPKAPPDTVRAK